MAHTHQTTTNTATTNNNRFSHQMMSNAHITGTNHPGSIGRSEGNDDNNKVNNNDYDSKTRAPNRAPLRASTNRHGGERSGGGCSITTATPTTCGSGFRPSIAGSMTFMPM